MNIQALEPDNDKLRDEETDAVKHGYACLFSERRFLNDDPAACSSPESAYFLHLEQNHLDIPDYLAYPYLTDDIGSEHHTRMERIWKQVSRHWQDLSIATTLLSKKLQNPPENLIDPVAEEISETSQYTPQERFQAGVKAIASRPERLKERKRGSELLEWKMDEKNSRTGLDKIFKKYITALRAYYEMLLEHDGEEFVLSKNSPHREKIVIRNRHLKVIDSFYHSSSVAKAAHHEQLKKRVRKAEGAPYVGHPMRSAVAAIYDVLPYTIQDRVMADIGMTSLTILCAIHDVTEDSDTSAEDVIEKLRELIDKVDSSLIQAIRPGFEEKFLKRSRNDRKKRHRPEDEDSARANLKSLFRKKILTLINTKRTSTIRQGLRILSNKTQLRGLELRQACDINIAGKKKLRELMGLTYKSYKSIQYDHSKIKEMPQSSTFRQFPREYDKGKMGKFLIKLTAISSKNVKRQTALIAKIEDRADNIASQRNMPLETQLSNVRAAASRLISWCMEDHDQEDFPLYNALPRLIDACITEYTYLVRDHVESLEVDDTVIIEKLLEWQAVVKRYETPDAIKKVELLFESNENA